MLSKLKRGKSWWSGTMSGYRVYVIETKHLFHLIASDGINPSERHTFQTAEEVEAYLNEYFA